MILVHAVFAGKKGNTEIKMATRAMIVKLKEELVESQTSKMPSLHRSCPLEVVVPINTSRVPGLARPGLQVTQHKSKNSLHFAHV
jgi:hypothetical protein